MKKIVLGILVLVISYSAKADEGMWVMKELDKISASRMQELGFQFPLDSLYSESDASLKDAVVIFGGGCTGVAVSNKGLIFTNHHCGYGAIQKLSAVEHDYLKNGFASFEDEDELPAEGLKVSFLKETKDITDFITSTIVDADNEEARNNKIAERSTEYLEIYKEKEFLDAKIIPFYSNNKYYLIVYEVFKDIRLVFAPPQSVGKFGGETDNWMWPRHTGDFSVFRVYANKSNQAADYSEDNIPYTPKYTVPISIKGYEEGDYAMTIGYPGRTQRYIPSWGIEQMVESVHKPRIKVRGAKQAIWREAMNADDATRIKYASKYAISSNYWKNAMGMNEAITNMGVIESKEAIETRFSTWVNIEADRKAKFGSILSSLQEAYIKSMALTELKTYFYETFDNGIELVGFAKSAGLINLNAEDKDLQLTKLGEKYKDYNRELDRELTPVLLELYRKSVDAKYLPAVYKTINKKFKGDYKKYANWLFNNTKLTNLVDAKKLLSNSKAYDKDPAIELARSLAMINNELDTNLKQYKLDIEEGNRKYMAGLLEMNTNKALSPDANFTQRLSYGSVQSYVPADAVYYDYYSSAAGISQKYRKNNPEFHIQEYILEAIKSENFGQYADQKDGLMHVNFLSNNDITGGNSGSPVMNANAELIGLAFDGNWEALSGDIVFNPKVQRCINLDIRYALYIIDKVMNCKRIINELEIAR